MTKQITQTRRGVLKAGVGVALVGGVTGLTGCATTPAPKAATVKNLGRVVVVGGGFGGATAAKYLQVWGEGAIEVVLIERSKDFYSCPISNLVLGGDQKIDYIRRGYEGLTKLGINVVIDEVTGVDPVKQTVSTRKGESIRYDRLVVSPGVDFNFGAVAGLTAEAQKVVLHSWKAGAQTVALRAQLEAMPNGGTFVMTIPKAPYRCPPGPYERACQVANYFKREKPKSKVLILDANPDIVSKKGLFTKAWAELYPGLVSYNANMNVTELDLKGRTLVTEVGERVQGDVLNVIPPQSAGDIARSMGLVNVNNLWCGVDWLTMESTAVPKVHVLGDSTLSAPLPVTMANTCYSFVSEKQVVHVASVHQYDAEKKTFNAVQGAGGLSAKANELEGVYAYNWAQNIWADMLT